MSVKLSLKDAKLLYELSKNSRLSYSQLSKKVALKKETVRYKLNSFLEKGVILKLQAVVDISKLGLSYHKIFFSLRNASENQRKKFIDYLTNHSQTAWVGEIDGSFDLGITLLAKSHFDVSSFLSDLMENFGSLLEKRVISTNLEGTYFLRDYLLNKKRLDHQALSYSSKPQMENFDEFDFEILKKLCQNSRSSAVELTKFVALSHDAIMKRIKKLESKGVISGYGLILNTEKIERFNYKVLLSLRDYSSKERSSLLSFLASKNIVTYVVNSLGNWDVDFEVESSVLELRRLKQELTDRFPNLIDSVQTLLIYNFTKYTFIPENYFYVFDES